MTANRLRVLGLLAAAALSGCGLVPGAHQAAAPAPVPAAHRGGVLTVGISRPAAVDPGSASEPASRLIASTMCDTLLNIDPKTNQLLPGIVEKWLVSEQYDATDIVLKIRHGLKFSDGTPVDAKAIEKSLSRLALADYASPASYLLAEVAGFEAIQGQRDKASDYARHNLVGVRLTDPYGLEIALGNSEQDIKDSSFVRALADPALAPVSERQVGDFTAAEHHPVCSGPYRLAGDWQPADDTIRLVRNPGYQGVNPGLSGYGAGYADEIDFKVYKTDAERYQAFRHGKVDLTAVPLSLRSRAQAMGPDFVEADDDYVQYVGTPFGADSPFSSADVRIAVSQALDRTAITDEVYGGGRLPATGIIPPALGVQFQKNACGGLVPTSPDLTAAQQHLATAHTSLAGKKVNFYFATGYRNEALAAAVARQLKAAFGLVLVPVPLPGAEFARRASSGSGLDGFYAEGWSSTVGLNPDSADAYIQSLTTLSGGDFNGFVDPAWARYFQEKVRNVYSASSETDDEAERDQAFKRAETLVCGLMPIIPVAFGRVHYLVRTQRLGAATGRFLDVRGMPLLRETFVR